MIEAWYGRSRTQEPEPTTTTPEPTTTTPEPVGGTTLHMGKALVTLAGISGRVVKGKVRKPALFARLA